MFGLMAGVRGVDHLHQAKGVPTNVSWYWREALEDPNLHNHSHLSQEEFKAVIKRMKRVGYDIGSCYKVCINCYNIIYVYFVIC